MYYGYFFFTLVSSTLISYLSIKKIILIGQKYNFTDNPNDRKIHKLPKVNLGGISIFLGFIIPTLSLILFENITSNYLISSKKIFLILLISLMIFLLGLWDDLKNISPFLRLFFEFVLGSLIFNAGIKVDNIDISILNINSISLNLPDQLSFFFTVIWIIAVINAINWLDGLDGQLAISTIISSLTIIILCIYFKNFSSLFLASSMMGACIGFLPKNLYPSKIIMGDSGSYLIGILLAILSLTSCTYISVENIPVINIWFPVILLSLPLGDMLLVILTRFVSLKSPFSPDKNHFHHRLLKSGFKNHEINQFVLFFNLVILFFTLCLIYFNKYMALIFFAALVFILINFIKSEPLK